MTRQHALETAFCDLSSKCGPYPLRPLSAGSFTLLHRLGNPMLTGEEVPQAALFEAVLEYVWVHSAPIEEVAAIRTREDLPVATIALVGYGVPMGEIFRFLADYAASARRVTLTMAAPAEEDTPPGKPVPPETPLISSPSSSTPSVPPGIPSASGTSSGTPPSNAPSPISTPPAPPPEPPAASPTPANFLTILPPPPPSSEPSAAHGGQG